MQGINGIKGFTIEQLTTEWGCSRQSIWRWVGSGELPMPITLGNRRKFWPASVIEAFLARKLKDAQRASQAAQCAAKGDDNCLTNIRQKRRATGSAFPTPSATPGVTAPRSHRATTSGAGCNLVAPFRRIAITLR